MVALITNNHDTKLTTTSRSKLSMTKDYLQGGIISSRQTDKCIDERLEETNMLPDNDTENLFVSRISILGLLLLVALLV